MFKSSTALLLALALGLSVALAQQSDPRQTGNVLGIKPDAPDQYVVQRGDTLWGIAGKFLSEPWRWPDIWRLNKEQIRNPHLIYPGNVVRLDRATGMLSIERVEPRVRVEPLAREAIPTIPLKVIEPFLARPLVIERGGLDKAPQIVATQEGRFNIGAGSRAYVDGVGGDEGNAVAGVPARAGARRSRHERDARRRGDLPRHRAAHPTRRQKRTRDGPDPLRGTGDERGRPARSRAAAADLLVRAARAREAGARPHHVDLRRPQRRALRLLRHFSDRPRSADRRDYRDAAARRSTAARRGTWRW